MSPRELDPRVIQARLGLMRDLLDDLRHAGELSAARLRSDRMLRHAVERILSQLVDLAVSINSHIAATVDGKPPSDYRSSFDSLQASGILPDELTNRLRRSVGLRNVLTHEYARVDLDLVSEAAQSAGSDYEEYVRRLAEWLKARGPV